MPYPIHVLSALVLLTSVRSAHVLPYQSYTQPITLRVSYTSSVLLVYVLLAHFLLNPTSHPPICPFPTSSSPICPNSTFPCPTRRAGRRGGRPWTRCLPRCPDSCDQRLDAGCCKIIDRSPVHDRQNLYINTVLCMLMVSQKVTNKAHFY